LILFIVFFYNCTYDMIEILIFNSEILTPDKFYYLILDQYIYLEVHIFKSYIFEI